MDIVVKQKGLKSFFKIILWIIVFESINYYLRTIVTNNIEWYNTLEKARYVPENYIFHIVWTILYFLLGIVGYILWESRKALYGKQMLYLYIVHILLNYVWIPLFFVVRYIRLPYLLLFIKISITFILINCAYKHRKIVFYLLIPYFIWMCFAIYLHSAIYILN